MPAQLPIYELKTRAEAGTTYVWCVLRKKYLLLTPEENVRQCLVQYLLVDRGVPRGLISIERGLVYNARRKRYDLLVFDRAGQPLLACECKAPQIPIDEAAAFQLATYNKKIGAPYLLLTNGPVLLQFRRNAEGKFIGIEDLPAFAEMIEG
ncbi:MAG: type I restriction enzyme HsdR N-terminal domain-containing protein [Bacteroidota bacterium]